MTEKDGFLPPDQRLVGAANISMWLLTIAGILLSLGYSEFLGNPPVDPPAAVARRWDLSTASEHSRTYGHVVKNINNAALQAEALQHQQDQIPLRDFFARLRLMQRSEIEIAADIDQLVWQHTDNVTGFFQRGQLLFNEMTSAHPGSMTEFAYLCRMISKLPARYLDASRVVTGAATLHGAQPSLERTITFLKQVEAQDKVAGMKSSNGAGRRPPAC